jgi:lantibiotic biosynthesis protein
MVTPLIFRQSTHLTNWQPILSPGSSTAALAWESINAIADSIVKKDYVRAEKEEVRNLAHLNRTYEEALIYEYLAVVHNDTEWANRATECLNLAIEKQVHAFGYLGLYGGVAGLGWTVEHVSRLSPRITFDDPDDRTLESSDDCENEDSGDNDLNQEVDALILRKIPEMTSSSPYDLISGLVGLGVYFLERLPRESAARGIRAVFDKLENLAWREDQGVTWFSGRELLPEWQREQCPNGYYNLGVAHGIPGIIHFLSEVSATDAIAAVRVNTLLTGAMEWLIAHVRPKGSASRFSAWIVPGQDPADSRMAWCYGDLGILAVLLQVARRTGRRDWRNFAQEVLDHCLSWPVEKAGIGDAPLCHGAAGVAHIFNRIYQQEGDSRCRDAALLWYERTLSMRRPGSGVGGYSSLTRPESNGPIVWDPSPAFLDGANGVALALLGAVTSVEPGWDRLMLLSGRH